MFHFSPMYLIVALLTHICGIKQKSLSPMAILPRSLGGTPGGKKIETSTVWHLKFLENYQNSMCVYTQNIHHIYSQLYNELSKMGKWYWHKSLLHKQLSTCWPLSSVHSAWRSFVSRQQVRQSRGTLSAEARGEETI